MRSQLRGLQGGLVTGGSVIVTTHPAVTRTWKEAAGCEVTVTIMGSWLLESSTLGWGSAVQNKDKNQLVTAWACEVVGPPELHL